MKFVKLIKATKNNAFVVKDEELNETMGENQLIEYANDQLMELDDDESIKRKYRKGISDVNGAIEVLNARGFEVTPKAIY